MIVISAYCASCGNFPYFNHLVGPSSSDVLSIRGPCHCEYCIRGALRDEKYFSRRNVLSRYPPDLYPHIFSCRGNISPVRRPGYCMYRMCMASIDELPMASRCVPDLYCAISTCRSDKEAMSYG